MTLRWSASAKKDLKEIVIYLTENALKLADSTARRILRAPAILVDFPHIGRPGKKPHLRELVLTPLPYLIVYRVTRKTVQVLRIFHGKQNWKS